MGREQVRKDKATSHAPQRRSEYEESPPSPRPSPPGRGRNNFRVQATSWWRIGMDLRIPCAYSSGNSHAGPLPRGAGNSHSVLLGLLLALLFSTAAVRADLILEQQSGETNHFHLDSLKLHGDKMRLDQPDNSLSVIVDLKTRDSITLITTNKTYLRKFGSEVRWEMEEDLKYTHGTNEMDAPPARPVATGKSELVSGQAAEIYTWSGAHGLKETLWVATNFPNYDLIQAELAKVDHFNDTGPHRNAQPELSLLPGMVLKRSSTRKGHTMTTTLVSVKVGPVDAALFELPKDYSPWKPAEKKP